MAVAAILLLCHVPARTAASGLAPLKYEEPKLLRGTIYTADRNRPLFKFVRHSIREGNRLTVSREYTYLNGQPALKERVIYEGDELNEYDVDDLQLGSRGSAKIIESKGKPTIFYEFQKDVHSSKKPKTATEPFTANCVIGDMVAPFLMGHWNSLIRGEEIKCRYIVVDRRETVGFTFVKDGEVQRNGQRLVIVKMYPTSRIISALVDPLYFTIEMEGQRRVLEYSGRIPVKLKEGNKWKEINGVTVFEW